MLLLSLSFTRLRSVSLPSLHNAGEGVQPQMLRYSYYTAGSGGAGPTILETSFLLAGEPCTVYRDGTAFSLPPISNRREVDFGPGAHLAARGVLQLLQCVHACMLVHACCVHAVCMFICTMKPHSTIRELGVAARHQRCVRSTT